MELNVSIELGGREYRAGSIRNECFVYDKEYIDRTDTIPISVSLPFQTEAFTSVQTRCFFEGLLPEGFTRKTVAQWIHADESDYLGILAELGRECLGAVRITQAGYDEAASETAAVDTTAGGTRKSAGGVAAGDKREAAEGVYGAAVCIYERLSMEQVQALAQEGASKSAELVTQAHLSLTGASGKVGLYYDAPSRSWYLPKGSAPSTHIVKQSHVRYSGIVVNEQLSMLTAKKLGIYVPETFIIDTGHGEDRDILFATARYDRAWPQVPASDGSMPVPLRLHQEDFGQALGISAAQKYEPEGSQYFEMMFELLRHWSSDPVQDQLKLWKLTVFNYLLGNTDAHLKNYSLLRGANPKTVRLSPAYDLVSTTVYEGISRDMAFRIGGRHGIDEIDRSSFRAAAKEAGLGERIAMQHFDRLADDFRSALQQSAEELTAIGFADAVQLSKKVLTTGGYSNL